MTILGTNMFCLYTCGPDFLSFTHMLWSNFIVVSSYTSVIIKKE